MSADSATLERAGSSSGDLTLRTRPLPVGTETTADHGSDRARGLRTAYNPRAADPARAHIPQRLYGTEGSVEVIKEPGRVRRDWFEASYFGPHSRCGSRCGMGERHCGISKPAMPAD